MNPAKVLFDLCLVLVAALPLVSAGNSVSAADARYYPLVVGTVWTYEVHAFAPKAVRSRVKWTVTHSSVERGRTIFQVWPKPMQSDDEAMQLAVTPQGIVETTEEVLILRFPIASGDKWSQSPLGAKHLRNFYISSVNKPCEVGRRKIAACVVVEEKDSDTGMRTVTTYGRDIGPVRYEYYRQQSGKETLIQRVSLVEQGVATR